MKRTQLKKAQSGFTLIELIVVIVILGILAATALPKFASLASDARTATLNGAKGSLASAAAMAHGKFLVANTPPPSATYEGATVTFVNGYPAADSGLATAAGITTADFTTVGGGGAAASVTANTPATTATEIAFIPNSVAGTAAGSTCFVKYAEAASSTAAPTITVTSTGC